MAMTQARIPESMVEIAFAQPGGPEVLQPRSVPVPVAGTGEILVRVAAAGVNRADVLQREGKYPLPPDANPTLGLEISGTVAAVGDEVLSVGVGEAVCALTNGGGYAEYCVVPAGQALPIPAGLSRIEAAAIPETYFTVWANLFDIAHAAAGDTVLVHGGSSGIGITTIVLCKELGINVIATAGSSDKCDAVRELGAHAVNYRQSDFVKEARAVTDGRGVDVVIDTVGGPYFQRNLDVLAHGGRLLLIGSMQGPIAERVNLQPIMQRRLIVTGSALRPRSIAEKAAIAEGLLASVWPALAAGRCRPIVHEVFPLERAADAHRTLEAGGYVGRLILEIAER
jgi:putative PIG3 family NAD(P)H quinone oxidoreductase